jgi:hypothetical protein
MQTISTKRTIVDVDTRRKVFVLARARKPQEQAKVPNEAFIRQQLKACMGYGPKDSAPDSIKAEAENMAARILSAARAAAEAQAAKVAAKA